jgi:serine/threonine protein kinase
LKPSNILLTSTGTAKILDFGLALCRQPQPAAASATDSGLTMMPEEGVFGTVCYMSPEQIRAESLDHRSNIFSLGVVYHEIAAGRLPFEGTTSGDMIASILRDQPRPMNEWNTARRRFWKRCK